MNPSGSPSSRPEGTVIGRNIRLKGEISGDEDLYLDGAIEGSVQAPGHRVTVGPGGQVKATILAREVIIEGKVHGRVEANERMHIAACGSMNGAIATPVIAIQEGAWFYGNLDTRSRTSEATQAKAARV